MLDVGGRGPLEDEGSWSAMMARGEDEGEGGAVGERSKVD